MATLSGEMMVANTSEILWMENSFSMFTLDVNGSVTPTMLTTIKNAVQNTWQSHTNSKLPNICMLQISQESIFIFCFFVLYFVLYFVILFLRYYARYYADSTVQRGDYCEAGFLC